MKVSFGFKDIHGKKNGRNKIQTSVYIVHDRTQFNDHASIKSKRKNKTVDFTNAGIIDLSGERTFIKQGGAVKLLESPMKSSRLAQCGSNSNSPSLGNLLNQKNINFNFAPVTSRKSTSRKSSLKSVGDDENQIP